MRWQEWRQTEIGRLWTVNALAAELGVVASTVHRWDRVMPSHETMAAIAVLTGFRVMPNDWFPEIANARRTAARLPPVPRRRRRGRAAGLGLAA